MNKITDFDGIGYVAATFPVASETQTYLKENYLNASTGNVDINGKKLAVTLADDGTVKFGTGTEPLLGIIMTYEMDGFAAVQLSGGVDEVPTSAEIKAGMKTLAVNEKGEIVEAGEGNKMKVVKPSAAENLFASIVL